MKRKSDPRAKERERQVRLQGHRKGKTDDTGECLPD